VLAIHEALVADFRKSRDPIDPPGVRSESLLGSAVMRPYTSLGGVSKYPSLPMAAAALFHALVLDHPFHNGNKRTGLVSLVVFLDKNDHVLRAGEDELYEYVLRVADHRIVDGPGPDDPLRADREMLKIAQWIHGRTRRVGRGEQILQFRQLERILKTYGCEFEIVPGNRVNIRRGGRQTQVFYASKGRDVEPNTIHKIRTDLELDDEHGYDSTIFYNREQRIPEFITRYRRILERLAKD
jgi:death-on-curing protein